ncbi:hypothetical protein ACSBR2_034225 [Camellia fascicularis]
MPVSLQDKCMFSLLGHCAVDLSCNGQSLTVGVEENSQINSTNEKNNWIQLEYDSHGYIGRKIKWIPKLHHIHWNGQRVSHFDVHVIVYETPMVGSHHFSLGFWSSEQVKNPLKKPKWFEELHQKQPLLDLEMLFDTVVLAINCANAAKLFLERHVGPERSTVRFPIVYMCVNLTWQLLSMSIASLSTLVYIIFQFLHVLLSSKSQSWMYLTLEKVFSKTWKNIQIRCSQILYWPILLKDDCLRSHSCVEYAEKGTFHKHSMWSSVAIDVLLGYFLGIALFFHAESACLWVSNFADDITNYLLRTGCVWLMGVPAGFKLNTELARVLGMISLNTIQIWSTLWFFVGSLFIHFVEVLAISAVVFGLTTPAALIIDMILLATLHVSTLHWLISHLYSHQIQAITALWRLFRYVFSVVSRSFVASSAYGVLTGKRIPSTLGTGLPSIMPWMLIPCKEYWLTCRDAVLAWKADRHRDSFQ